jgi:hypothetical protein
MAWTDPISDPQITLIKKLADEKDLSSLPEAQRKFLLPIHPDTGELDTINQEYNLRRMNKEQAHEAINLLMQLPKVAVEVTPVRAFGSETPSVDNGQQYTVRAGYYFVTDPEDSKEKFFRVTHGREGTRWEGYTFLHAQSSDDFYPVQNKEYRERMLALIVEDPITAMNEYGIRIGNCGVCGRTLTDRDSRLRGIGPICAAKLAVEQAAPTETQTNILRQLGLLKS